MERRRAIELTVKGIGFSALTYGITDWTSKKVFGAMSDVEVQKNIREDDAKRNIEPQRTYRIHPEFEMNGIPIELVGVSHHPETFLKNKEKIEQQVSEAGIVVLEYFDRQERTLAKPGLKDSLNNDIRSHNVGTSLFFAAVASICAEQEKEVAIINPESAKNQKMEMYMLSGIPAAALASDVIESGIRVATGALGIKMKRFRALNNAAYLAGGLTWLSWAQMIRQVRKNNEENQPKTYENRFAWNEVDFRDAKSAENLDTLSERIAESKIILPSEKKRVLVIQGSAHEYLQKYIEDPVARRLKLATYPHHIALSESMRRFHFDQIQQLWIQQA